MNKKVELFIDVFERENDKNKLTAEKSCLKYIFHKGN